MIETGQGRTIIGSLWKRLFHGLSRGGRQRHRKAARPAGAH
jgi:hypothetical protein